MQIKSKQNIIDYFNDGIKKNLFIGVENEKFLFEKGSNKRANYNKVRQVLEKLKNKFKWEEIKEGEKVDLEIKYLSGDIKKIKTLCRIDTKNELEYYKNGGILQYVLRNMI